MDEGLPIAYQLLEDGVPVLASGGEQVGTVASVLADGAEDVFHGLLVKTHHGVRFVEASAVSQIHEHGVDLSIDADEALRLPPPEHRAPVYSENPSHQGRWHHWVNKLSGRSDWDRER